MTSHTYDLIVIGAGPVGENVADYAHKAGLSVAIVESELVGGECSYWACMPSKALLRTGQALHAAEKVGVTGTLDVAAVLKRRDSFTSEWNDSGQVEWLTGAGIDLVRGHGRLAGEKVVEVTTENGTRTLHATHAVAVCTGSAALLPHIDGLADVAPWTSREATAVEQIPARTVIIGGGVVAAEMATAYQALGSAVTVVARSGLLGTYEPFAGDLVAAELRSRGATVVHGSPASVSRADSGEVTVTLDDGEHVVADEIIVATGRTPRTEDLGLATVGLSDGDWLSVDDTMRVTDVEGGWLYAAGDVNHRALLTHQGKYQARAAGMVIAARAQGDEASNPVPWSDYVATADHQAVPQVVFTEPEVASVGLTAKQATDLGLDIRVVDYALGNVAGSALHADGYEGQARMIVDESRQVIVGVTFAGPDVSELIHSATIAVVGEVPLSRLWHAVPSYPTISEIWLRLLETYRAEA